MMMARGGLSAMNKKWSWRFWMSLALIGASFVVYAIHYLIFQDLHHILIYLIGDIGFLFINVLVVTLLIEQLLSRREKLAMMKKMNMVIGTFFSEVGLELLKKFPVFVENASALSPRLEIQPRWQKKDFVKGGQTARDFSYKIRVTPADLRELRTLLVCRRSFLLRLLENPNLLEHDRFTDLLWAVFHLAEELEMRGESLENLPESDYLHIAGDIKRAYSQIASEWLSYTLHLKENYPFLFSLAARINPFSPNPSVVVS
jgi:hypothetical protein